MTEPTNPLDKGSWSLAERRRSAALEIAGIEKVIRFNFLEYVNGLVGDLWSQDRESLKSDNEEPPEFFLGHYDSFEGIANAGLHGRTSLVMTWVKEQDYLNSQKGGKKPCEFLYLVFPVDKKVLDLPAGSELSYIPEVFIAEVNYSPDNSENPIASYKQVTNTGVYDYRPTNANLSDMVSFLDDPKRIEALGERKYDPAYVLGVYRKLNEDMVPIPHSELDPEQRIIAFTGDYFKPITNDY